MMICRTLRGTRPSILPGRQPCRPLQSRNLARRHNQTNAQTAAEPTTGDSRNSGNAKAASGAPPDLIAEQDAAARFKWYAVAGTFLVVLAGGTAAWYAGKHDGPLYRPRQHRNDGPVGKFEEATSKVRVATKPSKDREWSSYMPDWSPIGDRIIDVLVPQWANSLPGFLDKLMSEVSGEPGTLAEEMWREAQDPSIHPEIVREASVRISTELCPEEQRFREQRKPFTRKALAKYLDLNEDDIDPEDVPTIAMCGSGGGLRAMVAGASSYYSAQKAGLFDCVTYTAGVSGSCWLQTLYYSTITGQKFDKLLQHLKDRLGVHIAYPPDFLRLVTGAPTNKFLMAGGYERFRGYEHADFGIVDAYGVMLGARLLVPKGDLAIDDSNLKLSNQSRYVDEGEHPLPIYTAVRHEIPAEEDVDKTKEEIIRKAKKEAWFQWFEWTPWEFFCEELGAGIPTWSLGRHFEGGRSQMRENGLALPEIRVPLLMGIYASAFCATLSHYYHEIKPLIKGLTGFGGLDEMIESRNEDLIKVHPVDPAQVPNFALGLKESLPKSCPESIHKSDNIQLMDAGMSNNLPIYPLLRPGRNVDIIIAFDASADIKQDNWLKVTDGYARQRGIKGWPIGTGWPDEEGDGPEQLGKAIGEANEKSVAGRQEKIQEAATAQQGKEDKAAQQSEDNAPPHRKPKDKSSPTELGFCNIWVGTTEERLSDDEPPRSKLVEDDMELMRPNAGIAVIYFPFMANPKVEGVDPQTSEYMSTWNFIYTPEQIEKVVELAKRNFDEGEEKVKKCIRAVYERKKAQREEREKGEEQRSRWWQMTGK